MWNDHYYHGYIINHAFCSETEMVWYFIGVCKINRTLHGHLKIQNFSSHSLHSWNIFQHLKRNFLSPFGHVLFIYSIAFELDVGNMITFACCIVLDVVLLLFLILIHSLGWPKLIKYTLQFNGKIKLFTATYLNRKEQHMRNLWACCLQWISTLCDPDFELMKCLGPPP